MRLGRVMIILVAVVIVGVGVSACQPAEIAPSVQSTGVDEELSGDVRVYKSPT